MSSTQAAISTAGRQQPNFNGLDTIIQLTSENTPKTNLERAKAKFGPLFARRNAKARSKAINGRMLYLNSPLHKDYQRSYECSENMKQEGFKFKTYTCMKRSCLVCARIKEVKLYKQYVDVLMQLPDLHLVTLTAPTVTGDQLNAEIKKRYKVITSIKDAMRKQGLILKGLRKLEITHNWKVDKYHPHYHLIVSGKVEAELIRTMWLKRIPEAVMYAQDVREVTKEKVFFELFKYVTKDVVEDQFNSKALDTIYTSIKGTRTIQAFGIKKKAVKYEADETIIQHKGERIDLWKWCKDKHDWYTQEGEQLNEGELNEETKKALKLIKNETDAKNSEDRKESSISNDVHSKPSGKPNTETKAKAIMQEYLLNVIKPPGSGSIPIEYQFN